MRKAILVLSCLLAFGPAAFAQSNQGASAGAGSGSGSAAGQGAGPKDSRVSTRIEDAQAGPKFVRTLTNVQVELTISDQVGNGPTEKKTILMIVASGNWGKIRASAVAFQKSTSSSVVPVGLNVDARPFVAMDGAIQLELTLVYNPLIPGQSNDSAQVRPTELNQSLTVILQSGKPMTISQAADPVADRKVIVEVKATVLK